MESTKTFFTALRGLPSIITKITYTFLESVQQETKHQKDWLQLQTM